MDQIPSSLFAGHQRCNGHDFKQGLGVGDGQGSLECCSPWSHKESDTAERLNWTDGLCSPPCFSVHRVAQAKIMECVVISSSRESSWPRDRTCDSCLVHVCMCAKSLQLCPILCDPVNCSPPGCSVHGILQARILQWGAISSSRESSWPRDGTHISCISCIGRQVLHH